MILILSQGISLLYLAIASEHFGRAGIGLFAVVGCLYEHNSTHRLSPCLSPPLSGLALERRKGFSEMEIVLQIFFRQLQIICSERLRRRWCKGPQMSGRKATAR